MCLYVNTDRHYKATTEVIKAKRSWEYDHTIRTPIEFVATQPLIVKKRVRRNHQNPNSFHSPYQYTPIKFGVKLTTDMQAGGIGGNRVEHGFHAYTYDATALSWSGRPTLMGRDVVTIYGVIPAGARYYMGTDEEIVTDTIIYFRDLKSLRDHYGMKKVGKPVRGDYQA